MLMEISERPSGQSDDRAAMECETETLHKSVRGPHDELLGTATMTGVDERRFARAETSYENQDERFKLPQRAYVRQYAQLYYARLMSLYPVVKQRAEAEWPGIKVAKILDLLEGEEVVVVGTVSKNMKFRPSVMDEYSKDKTARAALAPATGFTADDDSCVLEDEGARMVLSGAAVPVHRLVTGVVMAVRGVPEPGGDFVVSDVCFGGVAIPPPRPRVPSEQYVALMSMPGVGNSSRSDQLQVQLAADYLSGLLGSPGEQLGITSHIVRVVVIGGAAGANEALASTTPFSRQHTVAMQPLKDLDMFLSELSATVPVDFMPGPDDPSNISLPQPPVHRALLPHAGRSPALVRATNPHAFAVGGVCFLGTAGQNVEDVALYARHEDRISILSDLLRWRHLAPTAPDSLSCFPYHDNDPFTLNTAPHVLFAGNAPHFATSVVSGGDGSSVRVVSVPRFSSTGTLVLVNLNTLKCYPITFDSSMKPAVQT